MYEERVLCCLERMGGEGKGEEEEEDSRALSQREANNGSPDFGSIFQRLPTCDDARLVVIDIADR